MKKRKNDLAYYIILGLMIIIIIGYVIFRGWVLAEYADTPLGEVPFWVHWLLWR